MVLQSIDWIIIVAFFLVLLTIGYLASKNAGRSAVDFFNSGRNMPWWLLGISMVATTFSCDTPNLVTDMVRQNGVAANWLWWAFLITGMLTVFIYAKLWNRSKVMTDLEFYEIRYSGKMAAFLRGFRAVYLGLFFNIMVIASVSLAFIKIAAVMLGLSPAISLIIAAVVVVFYAGLGGLKSILYTDVFQFSMAMVGAFGAAWYITTSPDIGGLSSLLNHPEVSTKLSLIPDFRQTDIFLSILIVPLAVQWWAAWYPGAEPGGGGYIAQRMLSAKSEKHAMGATLLFNFFHYALRPWPWIIVGLASIIIFPDIASMRTAFPDVPQQFIQNDFAYPAMLSRYLPTGFLGLVVASLIAAYMSTVASQLNWGSSYMVNDFYARFINKESTEKQKVLVGRLSTVVLMVFSVLLALVLKNALQAFQYMLMLGAGTGLIYILRWFWWRINAFTEIAAMFAAGIFSMAFIIIENFYLIPLDGEMVSAFGITFSLVYWNIIKFVGVVVLTTFVWVLVTYLTPSASDEKLRSFYARIRPGGPGWKAVVDKALAEGIVLQKEEDLKWDVPTGILCMLLGCVAVYSVLFSTGMFLYGQTTSATFFMITAIISSFLLFRTWGKLRTS